MGTQLETAENLIDRPNAAKRLNMSLRTLDGKIRDRSIPFVKLGKLVRFIPSDLQRFIEAHRVG